MAQIFPSTAAGSRPPTSVVYAGGFNYFFYAENKVLYYQKFETLFTQPSRLPVIVEGDDAIIGDGGLTAIAIEHKGNPAIRVYGVDGNNKLTEWCLNKLNDKVGDVWTLGALTDKDKTAKNSVIAAIPKPLSVLYEKKGAGIYYWAAVASDGWTVQETKLKIPDY